MDVLTEMGPMLGVGGAVALVFQLLKGDWGTWMTKSLAAILGGTAGYVAAGDEGALVTALAAFTVHSIAFAHTKLGIVLKQELLVKILKMTEAVIAAARKQLEGPKPPPS